MRAPCGPWKTLPGAPVAIFVNIQQRSHALHTFQSTALCFWGPCGPRRH